MDKPEQQEKESLKEKAEADEALRRERVKHGVPADGFPNAILISLRAKYRNPGQ